MRRFVTLALLAALALPVPSHASLLPQDDAGSGRDAPDVATEDFRIEPGVAYAGMLEGFPGDGTDWYAFSANAGDPLEARVSGAVECFDITDAAGKPMASTCSAGYVELGRVTAVAPVTGTYYLRYHYFGPVQAYHFSVGVGAAAPAPMPVETDPFGAGGGVAPVAPATQSGKHVVVAVVDTGVNLYHRFFRAPALTAHPSTWLPGFPASATPVSLSLGAGDWAAATTADEHTLAGLARSTYDRANDTFDTRLYTFPGTRVVGAVSFGEYDDPVSPPVGARPVLDDYGHGTHSAGLAAGAGLRGADGNVLIVAVEVGKSEFDEGVRWAARQPWIDALSVSLGQVANVPVTTSPTGDRGGMEWLTREAALAGKPVFMAAGNGFSNSGLTPDHCTTYTSPFTGPSWVTRIGAAEAGDGSPTWWHCVPVEAIARTNVPSPSFDDLAGSSSASGTSAATPNAAGHWAALMLAARRAGSPVTRTQAVSYLLHSAAPPPVAPGAHDPSVYPLSLADQGYGLVDQHALDAATYRLAGNSGPLPRPETEAWFAQDKAVRDALWGPGSVTGGGTGGGIPQNDAQSGRDAPAERSGALRILPGTRYGGMLLGAAGDTDDWYRFTALKNETVTAVVSAAAACVEIVSPAGKSVANTCTGGYGAGVKLPAKLTASGTWYLHVDYAVPQPYSFGFARNAAPPPVFP